MMFVNEWLNLPFSIVFSLLIPFWLWNYRQCRHLERSEERFNHKENFIRQIRKGSLAGLWFLEICSIALVAAGIFLVTVEWGHRSMGWYSIVIFGCTAIIVAKALMIKRRLGRGNS